MSASGLCYKNFNPLTDNVVGTSGISERRTSRRSLKVKFDSECGFNRSCNAKRSSRSNYNNWCDGFSISMSNINAKRAWKNGTEKLSQTLSNVRNTFGSLSQKITKSTRRRQPLINIDSPRTPATPHSQSKALLGRTPTKLYSPFHIDTPKEKENIINRQAIKKRSPNEGNFKGIKRQVTCASTKCQQGRTDFSRLTPEDKMTHDSLQTQIGIYEFQSVANKIVQKGKSKFH